MENYFNYFTEIEEHFQRRRGGILLLSTLDWALIETWKDAGIPLEAVLRGIDGAFESYEKRPSKRKVNSLAYCAQEVLAAAEEMKEAAVGVASTEKQNSKPAGFQTGEIVTFLRRNADQLLTAKLPQRPGISGQPLARETAGTLRELASEMESAKRSTSTGRSGAAAHRARRKIVCCASGRPLPMTKSSACAARRIANWLPTAARCPRHRSINCKSSTCTRGCWRSTGCRG